MELLFEAIKTIYKSGKVYSCQEKPQIDPQISMIGDSYTEGTGVNIGTVLKDGGRYRMWYTAWPEDYNGSDDTALGAYAESDNCIDWVKPNLGLIEYAGNKDNNLCNPGGIVFIDPEDEGYRYKACGFGRPGRASFGKPFKEEGYYVFHSKDGLIWDFEQEAPRWPGGDVISVVYHPQQKRAIIPMKYFLRVGDIHRRSIYIAEYKDGIWSEPSCALVPDEYDDICAKRDGFLSADYYGMGMMPAGKSTVGFLWQFRHTLPLKTSIKASAQYLLTNFASDGIVDISLVFQENPGDIWRHQYGRRNFISHDEDDSTRSIYSAASPVEVGDEQWLFYSSTPLEHVSDYGVDVIKKYGLGDIRIAKWKKNRLFGFKAVPEGVIEIPLGKVYGSFKIKINCRTEKEGSIKAYLYDSRIGKNGNWIKDDTCLIAKTHLQGDKIDEDINWDGKAVLTPPKPDSNLMLRLELKISSVYAYDVVTI